MMILRYRQVNSQVYEIKELLSSYSFAFKEEVVNGLQDIILQEGMTVHMGFEDIITHIRKLAHDTSQWWYCQCDG